MKMKLNNETLKMIEDDLVSKSGIMLSREELMYRRAIHDFYKMVKCFDVEVDFILTEE